MRTIKFRAWNSIGKEMSTPMALADWIYLQPHWKVAQPNNKNPYDSEDIVFMQLTGLTAGDGKEIYEGDILLYPDSESEHVDVGVGEVKVAETAVNSFYPVEFRDGAFGIEVRGGEVFPFASENSPLWVSLNDLFGDYVNRAETEVIGNIYENPELLTK